MDRRLLVLALAPFAFGSSAFGFAGVLAPMAVDLGVGVPLAGQLQTAFALACGVGGPLVAAATQGRDRKSMLLAVLAALCAFGLLSAAAPGFELLLGVRILAGLFCALTLPLATTIAVSMVSAEQRPAALALVLAGYTAAFLLGVPMGTVIGDAFGWRGAFVFAALVAALAALLIHRVAPSGVSAPPPPEGALTAATRGDNLALMALTLLAFTATFTTVSFIGPVVTASTGVEGAAIGLAQTAVGVGSLLGLPLGARLASMPVRATAPLLICGVVATQLLFTLGMAYDFGALAAPLLALTMTASSAALFALSPVVQDRLAASAGPAATLAFALNSSMIFFGQGLGAALGGAVAAASELAWIGVAGAGAGALALLTTVALQERRAPSDAG